MTIKELTTYLSKYPEDALIVVEDHRDMDPIDFNIGKIRLLENKTKKEKLIVRIQSGEIYG